MPAKTTGLCNWAGCDKGERARLEGRGLCLDHFLEQARRQVDSLRALLQAGATEHHLSPEVKTFLSEVVSETTLLATETRVLAPSQREELIALSTQAAEVFQQIQRTPRILRRLACVVRASGVATDAGEKSYTVNLSQRGACIELKQSLKVGQTISVERVDVGKSAKARVAWVRASMGERSLVGIEILDDRDFWGLGLAAVNGE